MAPPLHMGFTVEAIKHPFYYSLTAVVAYLRTHFFELPKKIISPPISVASAFQG
jgi:hypothetical protein